MLYIFDVNETILDMSGLDDLLAGAEQRHTWFDLLIRTALTRTAATAFRPFGQLGVEAAQSLGLDIDADQLRAAMSTLPAHPDVAEGLATISAAGHAIAALGNSALELIEEQLVSAGIFEHFDGVFSAETVGALKPAPQTYLSVLNEVAPSDAVMVAAHDWDIAGADAVGLRTVLLDRGLRPPLPGFKPNKTATTVGDCLL